MLFFKSFDEKFDDQLRKIIRQGDTTLEYRMLFDKIVNMHGEYFTEENRPTMTGYLNELLNQAIGRYWQTDEIVNLLQQIIDKPIPPPDAIIGKTKFIQEA